MVTTTVRMLDGIHSDTTDTGPVLPLGLGFVVGGVGTEERLVAPLSTSSHADHGSAAAEDSLPDARGESDTRLFAVLRMSNHNAGGTGGTGDSATVSELGLNA